MTTQSKTEILNQEEIVNDIEKPQVDEDKLAALKARAAAKRAEEAQEEAMPARIVEEKQRSIRFGIVGSGQGGSRLAEQWFLLGYPTIIMNTAQQDLEDIKIPEQQKLFMDFGLGGTARDLSLGYEASQVYINSIADLVHKNLMSVDVFIFCTSLGGGSGAGSVETVIDVLSRIGKPIVIMGILPKASEDAQSKYNAWQTLSKLTKQFNDGKIDNIIIADNAKIESIYSEVNPFRFFEIANKAIVETIDVFNKMSRRKSEGVKILDSNEFGKLFIDGKGFTVYGSLEVRNYTDEMAIATAIVESLNGNLLASGFDIKQAKYAGFMLVASERVWNQIPSSSLDFAQHMILDACDSPSVFHGIYKEDTDDDCIKVYSMFSGLGLPSERIDQLKAEAQQKMDLAKKKDVDRKLSIKVNVGEETINKVDEIKRKIQQNSSSFNKLNAAVQDRRKK